MQFFSPPKSGRLFAMLAALGAMMVLGSAGASAEPPNPLEPRHSAEDASPAPKLAPRPAATPSVWTLQCPKIPLQTFASAQVSVGKNASVTLVQTIGRDQTMRGWSDDYLRGGKLVRRDCSLGFGSAATYAIVQGMVTGYSYAGGMSETYVLSTASVTKAVPHGT